MQRQISDDNKAARRRPEAYLEGTLRIPTTKPTKLALKYGVA
jgi:hypothetical protein